MKKFINKKVAALNAMVFAGLVSGVESAHADTGFNQIIDNMETSISNIPGLISGVSYMMGILLGVLGILKIKDHVEDPRGTPLQQGAIRLAAGGGLFALPIVYEAMRTTIGDGDTATVGAPPVKALEFNTQ